MPDKRRWAIAQAIPSALSRGAHTLTYDALAETCKLVQVAVQCTFLAQHGIRQLTRDSLNSPRTWSSYARSSKYPYKQLDGGRLAGKERSNAVRLVVLTARP